MNLRQNIRFHLLMLNILCFSLLAINVKAQVKSQKVTVGMFNTYSTTDGNLGRAEPDLKEVVSAQE